VAGEDQLAGGGINANDEHNLDDSRASKRPKSEVG